MLENLRFDEIRKETLESLVAGSVPESRTLEYKSALPGGKDSDRKEFAGDVSAFANAGGGTIVFGVAESEGVAVEVCGLDVRDADEAVRRLQDMLRSGVAPKINGVQFRVIPGLRLGPAILMRIPRSWQPLHMVTCGQESRFYARSGARKEPLDVDQIRAGFLASHEAADRVRRFRDERLGRIVGDETPLRLVSPHRFVLHLVPLMALGPGGQVDLRTFEDSRISLRPIGSMDHNHRYNLEGFVTFAEGRGPQAKGYVQLFRTGTLEAVQTFAPEGDGDDAPWIPGVLFPRNVVRAVVTYMEAFKSLMLAPPVVVFLSFTGAEGMRVHMRPRHTHGPVHPLDRSVVPLPDVLFEDFPVDEAEVLAKLTPSFDALWQACGYPAFFSPDD